MLVLAPMAMPVLGAALQVIVVTYAGVMHTQA